MDTVIQFLLSLNCWNSQISNYSRVLSAQTIVYFICLKNTRRMVLEMLTSSACVLVQLTKLVSPVRMRYLVST